MSSTVQTPILETRSLVKRFGGLLATDQVSLQLAGKEVHALIGPNGAGKTTLIGQLSGELLPDEGQILIAGEDVTAQPVPARARRGLGRSYQITQFLAEFSALENVVLAALARSGSGFGLWSPLMRERAIVEHAMQALDTVGLADRAHRSAGAMGHGEHRQLEIAMALALEPKMLLLDEPLAGMSGSESERMVQLLHDLKARYPILLIEHDMDAVFALANRISVLVYGRVIATGTPQEIRNNPEVRTAYLGDEEMVA
ncbi:MAG: ABC transporter ATP-binding protein [Burkholderiales bacterium]|nr:ABC transporter ATP-binding protein [Burkholderiales bacterium]ODU69249.1 MAG: ABC transporter ATP-binding protein [Lautropia sp. SCN 66-9]